MIHIRKYAAGIGAAFAVAAAALCGSLPAFAQNDLPASQPEAAASIMDGNAPMAHAREAATFVAERLESSGYNPYDGHLGSRYGVVGDYHGLSSRQEVQNLTLPAAVDILIRDNWNANRIDDLPPNLRFAAFNAYVQFGPYADRMVANAHGDPDMLLQETADREEYLAARHPEKYGQYLDGWRHRQAKLVQVYHSDGASPFATPDQPTLTSAALPTDETKSAAAGPYSFHEDRSFHQEDFVRPVDQDAPDFSAHTEEPQRYASSASPAGNTHSYHGHVKMWWTIAAGLFAAPFVWMMRPKQKRYASRPMFFEGDPGVGPAGGASPSQGEGSQRYFDIPDLTEAEYEAFYKIFWPRGPERHEDGRSWKVNYENNAHVLIQPGHVTLHGDGGIEDTLKYAAHAWNNTCVLDGGTDEFRAKIKSAAQRLVNEGALAPGFAVEGIGVFMPETEPRTAFRPKTSPRFAYATGPAFAG